MSLHSEIRLLGDQALAASRRMVNLSTRRKNAILEALDQVYNSNFALLLGYSTDAGDMKAAVQLAYDAAKELGFTLNFADEYSWPSGHAWEASANKPELSRVLQAHPELFPDRLR